MLNSSLQAPNRLNLESESLGELQEPGKLVGKALWGR